MVISKILKIMNLLMLFFVVIIGYWSARGETATVTYDTQASHPHLREILESRMCEILPQLPACLQYNNTQDSVYGRPERPEDNLEVDLAPDNAFLAMAMDYIAATQIQNKELRERETQHVMQIARLEQEKEHLQNQVSALEEEWLPTVDKHPEISGRSGSNASFDSPSSQDSSQQQLSSASSIPGNLYHPTATFLRPVDCADHLTLGSRVSGVYEIYPFRCRCGGPIKVWCDMETDGGGWTVIIKRQNHTNLVNFTRPWRDYKEGFGNASTEYWIGNDNLHVMTNTRAYTLRLDFELKDGSYKWAQWTNFNVSHESNRYKLEAPVFDRLSMTDNCLGHHSNRYFSTFDYDNDASVTKNCAFDRKGGWWFNNCATLDPVIPYTPEGHLNTACTYKLNGKDETLKGPHLQMKIRPTICSELVKAVHFNAHTCTDHNGL